MIALIILIVTIIATYILIFSSWLFDSFTVVNFWWGLGAIISMILISDVLTKILVSTSEISIIEIIAPKPHQKLTTVKLSNNQEENIKIYVAIIVTIKIIKAIIIYNKRLFKK